MQSPPRIDISHAIDAIGKLHWCGAIKTSEDERRQLERDPLRDPKPMKFTEQWRHVIELPSTKYHPSSGVEVFFLFQLFPL